MDKIWEKIYNLKQEDYLNVSKEENLKQNERLTELEQELLDSGVDNEEIIESNSEFRSELYYEIYITKKL